MAYAFPRAFLISFNNHMLFWIPILSSLSLIIAGYYGIYPLCRSQYVCISIFMIKPEMEIYGRLDDLFNELILWGNILAMIAFFTTTITGLQSKRPSLYSNELCLRALLKISIGMSILILLRISGIYAAKDFRFSSLYSHDVKLAYTVAALIPVFSASIGLFLGAMVSIVGRLLNINMR